MVQPPKQDVVLKVLTGNSILCLKKGIAVFYRFYDVICSHHIVSGTRVELNRIYCST